MEPVSPAAGIRRIICAQQNWPDDDMRAVIGSQVLAGKGASTSPVGLKESARVMRANRAEYIEALKRGADGRGLTDIVAERVLDAMLRAAAPDEPATSGNAEQGVSRPKKQQGRGGGGVRVAARSGKEGLYHIIHYTVPHTLIKPYIDRAVRDGWGWDETASTRSGKVGGLSRKHNTDFTEMGREIFNNVAQKLKESEQWDDVVTMYLSLQGLKKSQGPGLDLATKQLREWMREMTHRASEKRSGKLREYTWWLRTASQVKIGPARAAVNANC